ncbi:MAG: UbiA family prenyltransferase [Halapricum sp.]
MRLRQAWAVFVYSSAYLAVIAMAKVLIVQYVLSLPLSPAPLVGGLATFAIYANDRLTDVETDVASNPERTMFVNRHRDSLYVLAAVTYGIAIALAALGGPVAFAMVVFPAVAWLLYGQEWVPLSRVPFRRLKEILVVNSALVAAAWSLSVVLVPLSFADQGMTPTALVLVSYFALGTFVNTEIANMSDMESDERNSVRTLPIALGIRRTKHWMCLLTLLVGAVLAVATLAGYLSLSVAGILSIGPLALLVVIARLQGSEQDNPLVIAAESTRLLVVCALGAVAVV